MKDMFFYLVDGLKFVYMFKREDLRDVLIFREGYKNLDDLFYGVVIGIGSKRRKF